jgi:hypothetical protein
MKIQSQVCQKSTGGDQAAASNLLPIAPFPLAATTAAAMVPGNFGGVVSQWSGGLGVTTMDKQLPCPEVWPLWWCRRI